MIAAKLNFSTIANFSASEWPEGTLEHMEAKVILALALVRSRLSRQHRIAPSPLPRAHVRDKGKSQHSTNSGERLSSATDCFMLSWQHLLDFWVEAQRVEEIGGIGLYTNRWYGDAVRKPITPMFHIDTRTNRVLWICRTNPVNGGDEYVYFHSNPVLFFEELKKIAEMSNE